MIFKSTRRTLIESNDEDTWEKEEEEELYWFIEVDDGIKGLWVVLSHKMIRAPIDGSKLWVGGVEYDDSICFGTHDGRATSIADFVQVTALYVHE